MGLSGDLISQFVKATNDDAKNKKATTTIYGTVTDAGDQKYVQFDGSDISTPVSTTVNVTEGDRVIVMIKNHSATITGNLNDPSVNSQSVDNAVNESHRITELGLAVAERVTTEQLNAESARIAKELIAKDAVIQDTLTASIAQVEKKLTAVDVEIAGRLDVNDARITNLTANKLSAEDAKITYATIANLEATDAEVNSLKSTHAKFEEATVSRLEANEADIDELNTKKLDAETAKITYANIDFSNIGQAAMEYFYATSGLIENVVISEGTVTGRLVGVTIKGDIIEGNTIVADKLVILGDDGLYYKLNTNGVTTESEQTEYNSLNGSIITAKTITATQISVDDLVAFDATIGGFKITENSIHSEVKDSDGNTTRGIYMDTDGQINFGDGSNYIKYFRDEDGTYKLVISAANIMYALNGKQYSIADLGHIGEYVRIGTYEDEPCIELGDSDSDFKLVITNTRIMFMEGTTVPAYISNQSLHITKAVIEEEIQQGNFVWQVRANGNLGLVWKGGS